jgi:hypothetical protein
MLRLDPRSVVLQDSAGASLPVHWDEKAWWQQAGIDPLKTPTKPAKA